jgi:hypothetical protein
LEGRTKKKTTTKEIKNGDVKEQNITIFISWFYQKEQQSPSMQ